MGKRLRGRGGIVFLFLVLSLFVGSCKREEGERAKEPFRGVNVEVREVRRESIPDVVTFVANLEPRQRTAIIPKVSGLIEKIYVREGDYVRKGDLLVKLEQKDYLVALQKAEAALEEAEANLEQASRDWRRFSELFKRRVISKQEYEESETRRKLALARFKSAQAALQDAKNHLEETMVKAPFAGFVTGKFKDEGERVRAGMPGQEAAILELEDISVLRATGHLPELEMGKVKVGMEAEVRVDAIPEKIFKGRVVVVNPTIDPSTRTFMVKVEIPNRDFVLKGNMFARVTIVKGWREALIVPREAVLREEGVWLYHCFVVKDGVAERRVVKPRFTPFWYVEIKEGLMEGEKVVVKGQGQLHGGERVAVKDEAS